MAGQLRSSLPPSHLPPSHLPLPHTHAVWLLLLRSFPAQVEDGRARRPAWRNVLRNILHIATCVFDVVLVLGTAVSHLMSMVMSFVFAFYLIIYFVDYMVPVPTSSITACGPKVPDALGGGYLVSGVLLDGAPLDFNDAWFNTTDFQSACDRIGNATPAVGVQMPVCRRALFPESMSLICGDLGDVTMHLCAAVGTWAAHVLLKIAVGCRGLLHEPGQGASFNDTLQQEAFASVLACALGPMWLASVLSFYIPVALLFALTLPSRAFVRSCEDDLGSRDSDDGGELVEGGVVWHVTVSRWPWRPYNTTVHDAAPCEPSLVGHAVTLCEFAWLAPFTDSFGPCFINTTTLLFPVYVVVLVLAAWKAWVLLRLFVQRFVPPAGQAAAVDLEQVDKS